MGTDVHATVDSIYRDESRRVYATLVRLLGDFELAEDAMHEAFAAAVERWSEEGVPANPRGWLVSSARFKAIDTIRRRARFEDSVEKIAQQIEHEAFDLEELDEARFNDDQLRLIFTCCHSSNSKQPGDSDGRPFAETKEQLGGILILEARDMNHAIELISNSVVGHDFTRP